VCPSRRSLLPANHSLFSVLLKLLSCPEGTAKSKPKAGEKYFTTAIFGHKVITKYSPSYTHTHTHTYNYTERVTGVERLWRRQEPLIAKKLIFTKSY